MSVKIEICDNGGWSAGPDAEWTEGTCADCDDDVVQEVLEYQDSRSEDAWTWKVCKIHLADDEMVRIMP